MAEKIKNWLLPLLFGSSVAYMIIKCYHNADAFWLTCVFFVYALFCFILFDIIKKAKKLTPPIYLLLFFIVIAVGITKIKSAGELFVLSIDKWFYGVQTEDTYVFEYSFALIFSGGFFLISILYYFTQVIYRPFGTMLIMFFPLFIYSKRLDTVDVFDFTVVLAFYLAVLIHNRQMKSDRNSYVVMNKSYIACIGVFVFIVSLIIFIIPQPDILAVQEKDNNYFTNLVDSRAPLDFSNSSSLSGGRLSDEILFYVYTDNPIYLRRQSYDNYSNFGNWYLDDDDQMSDKIPKDNINYVNNTTFVKLIETLKLADEILDDNLFDYPEVDFDYYDLVEARIENTDNFNPWYIQLPLNTVNLSGSSYNKMFHGEYKPVYGQSEYVKNNQYEFSYLNDKVIPDDFILKLDYSYSEILNVLLELSLTVTDEELLETIDDLYADIEYTSYRFNNLNNVSSKLSELALEITSGFDTPYEKAKALEGYFEEQNFEYSLDAYPDNVDDFVFNKKKGACGQFATAMTLMARAAGLTARYVEGFVVDEMSNDGDGYVVREYHSHAYVEIYINGIGWVVFEPTVSGFLDAYKQKEQINIIDVLKNIGFYLLLLVLIVFVLYCSRHLISEMFFRIAVVFISSEKTVIMCYNRLVKLLSIITKTDLSSKTSNEIRIILGRYSLESDYLILNFEKICYGYKNISNEDKINVVDEYKLLRRSIRKMKINY